MSGWVWLVNSSTNDVHRVPDDPSVVANFAARGWEVTDISGDLFSDDEEFAAALARRQASDETAELKGKALDDALDDAGLSRSGTVAEKQSRLAEFRAQGTVEADSATDQEGIE